MQDRAKITILGFMAQKGAAGSNHCSDFLLGMVACENLVRYQHLLQLQNTYSSPFLPEKLNVFLKKWTTLVFHNCDEITVIIDHLKKYLS